MHISIRFSAKALAAAGLGVVWSLGIAQASTIGQCVAISDSLSYGMSGSAVSSLQSFLNDVGYLNAKPNGHFGPATRSAVKAFQSAHGISKTGTTGPLTRAAISTIQAKQCAPTVSSASAPNGGDTTTVIGSPASSVAPSPSPSLASVSSPVSNMTIVSPATGQALSIGSSIAVRWTTSPSGVYNIVLEQPGGVGAGFVALSQSPSVGGNQYVWSVGKVFSSQTNTNQTAAVGTYRLRLQSASAGASPTDQVSGWFTLVAPRFSVSSVSPASVPADNATSVVLVGSGFSSSVSVYFDANLSSQQANDSYVSPDGTVLVFTVPSSVSAGPHTLFINNGAGSPSATASLTVSAVQ